MSSSTRPPLSVIIPAYNEVGTIAAVLDSVANAAYADKQVIVVDDGSRDGTFEAIEAWVAKRPAGVELIRHDVNRGKGAAIRTGLAKVRGEVVLVQDADLEYDPSDYARLVEPVLVGEADVVFGSRYLDPNARLPWTPNRVCVCLLNLSVWLLFGRRISDEATCYKVFRLRDLARMNLACERFEFCPEVTAKACRLGLSILEVPTSYRPRTIQDGKKIRWQDAVEAFWTLFRWRFAAFHAAASPFSPRIRVEPESLKPTVPA
jgi:glycosyltransferase involved in cell wall biosynthesis